MRTSIATVSISGDLARKAARDRRGRFRRRRDLRERFPRPSTAARPRSARWCATTGSRSRCSSRSATSRGCPSRSAPRAFERAERKFDVMQRARHRPRCSVCSNVSPAALGGIDRAAADFRELGERAQQRGLRVGYEALAWGRHINDHRDAWEIVRRADHPEYRPHPRQLPHPVAPHRSRFDPRHPRRQDLHRPARRRPADRHGPALLEPPLPQHARRGRPAGGRFHARRRRDRL